LTKREVYCLNDVMIQLLLTLPIILLLLFLMMSPGRTNRLAELRQLEQLSQQLDSTDKQEISTQTTGPIGSHTALIQRVRALADQHAQTEARILAEFER